MCRNRSRLNPRRSHTEIFTLMIQKHNEEHNEPAAYSKVKIQSEIDVKSAKKSAIDTVTVENRSDAVAQLIEQLNSSVRNRKRALNWLPVPAGTIVAALVAIHTLLSNDVTGIRPAYWALLAAFVAGNIGLMALLFSGTSRLNKTIRALSCTDDVQAIGAMAESLAVGEPALSIAGSLLIRLLPHMTSEDLDTLTPAQRKALRDGLKSASNRLMRTSFNPALARAILDMFERIGSADDLVVVERLAASRAITREQKLIRAAAESSVAVMKARIAGNSSAPVTQPSVEVRTIRNTTLSTETVETLSTRLRRIARIRRRNVAVTASAAVAGTGLALLSMTSFPAAHHILPAVTVGLFTCLASMVFFALSGTYTQRNLTNALIHSDDLRIVPPLIQAAATLEISGTAAIMLLTRLLPRLRASDSHLLNESDRTLLHSAIAKHARNSEFVLAAIRALQQIGSASSIPTVQRIAMRTDHRAASPAIREAAQECLEFLQQRAARSDANQTLLRSSSAAATPAHTLLRALDTPAPTAADELLRTAPSPITYQIQDENEGVEQNLQAFALQPAG
jgi:hypothetical protein